MGATDYLENQIGTHIFRSGTFTKPTELHVGLFLVVPTDLGDIANEVVGAGYGRVQIDPSDTNWEGPTDGDGLFINLVNIEFPQQLSNWGTIVAWAIFDQGANMLLYGDLVEPVDILLTTAKGIIPPGYLQISIG